MEREMYWNGNGGGKNVDTKNIAIIFDFVMGVNLSFNHWEREAILFRRTYFIHNIDVWLR